jgi:23S rRNA (cytidine1920-2'-O)/16S rRNA (cytidine1409-2'-O)-methyltransferase
MSKVRLDALLAERGLFPTRSRAAASVLAGEVLLGPGRRRADKPGQLVADDVVVDLNSGPAFVSRGGTKLANALDALDVDVTGRRCLDVGASTGGFTDCLLQRGASEVVAVDVAYGELDWTLRNDERVTVLERVNARSLGIEQLPWRPGVIVIDVSFIGLEKVLPAVLECAAPEYDCLAMVKPQFQLGPGRVGKGGVVRDAADRRAAVLMVAAAAREMGAGVAGVASSGLPGPRGNRETFLHLTEADRAGGRELDLDAALLEVDP